MERECPGKKVERNRRPELARLSEPPQELLDPAGKEVTLQTPEGELEAKAEAEPPDSGGGAQTSRGETSGPSRRLDSGSSSNCEAASMALSPAEPEPARAAGGQPQEEEKH
ncbi:uncharacterized protein LOC125318780 isoform X2 [Corvus hawaiiensis]|uniref:uncharacterized protein LOC125318780 isoform X2 n=1 Tax=Corvus hawaiiensis TaxID=134902 RepID=UPI00201840E6|nr:uncharacterized protein LOC125318780 isoform X2 [Corvus hawaiiensis]